MNALRDNAGALEQYHYINNNNNRYIIGIIIIIIIIITSNREWRGTGAQVRGQKVREFSGRTQGQRSRGQRLQGRREERGKETSLRAGTHRELARELPEPAFQKQAELRPGGQVYLM